jgi:hypothetical protein
VSDVITRPEKEDAGGGPLGCPKPPHGHTVSIDVSLVICAGLGA